MKRSKNPTPYFFGSVSPGRGQVGPPQDLLTVQSMQQSWEKAKNSETDNFQSLQQILVKVQNTEIIITCMPFAGSKMTFYGLCRIGFSFSETIYTV